MTCVKCRSLYGNCQGRCQPFILYQASTRMAACPLTGHLNSHNPQPMQRLRSTVGCRSSIVLPFAPVTVTLLRTMALCGTGTFLRRLCTAYSATRAGSAPGQSMPSPAASAVSPPEAVAGWPGPGRPGRMNCRILAKPVRGTITGVQNASPPVSDNPAGCMAAVGQALIHSPQRMHLDVISFSLDPGGRIR